MMRKVLAVSMACMFGFAATVLAQDISVRGVAIPADGGKVTGSAVVKPGKSVTLTASPTKGWAFVKWQDGNQTAKRAIPYAEAAAIADAANVAEYTATFILIEDLNKPVVTPVVGVVTGMVGVAFSLPVAYDSVCVATVASSKLPGGLSLKNGVISGVPKKAETVTVTLTASNPKGKSDAVAVKFEILPLPASAQGTFTGYFQQDADIWTDTTGEVITNKIVVGTFTMTVSSAGKMSAKVVTEKGKASLSAASWATRNGALLTAELKSSKGDEKLALTLYSSAPHHTFQMVGDLTGGIFRTTDWDFAAQKKDFSAKGDMVTDWSDSSQALLSTCWCYVTMPLYYRDNGTNALVGLPPKSSYNVVFTNTVMTSLGDAENAPQGHGYWTMTIKPDGAVKFAGKLADGKSFSGSITPMINSYSYFVWRWYQTYFPFYVPMYSGKGSFSGIPVTDAWDTRFLTDYVDWPTQWGYLGKSPVANPPQTKDAFAAEMACIGSLYNPYMDLSTFHTNDVFKVDAPNLAFTYTKGGYSDTVEALTNLLPNVRINPSQMTLPTGNANPAQATLSVTKSSGVFKGKFNVNYEYTDEKGVTKRKTVSVKHEGVLFPIRALDGLDFRGAGFYLMPDTYVDSTDPKKPVTYKLNRSFGVSIIKSP